jgi:hypothetical protein
VNSLRSITALSSTLGTDQVMPITTARMYYPIAVRPIPTDQAITRSLAAGELQPQNFSNLPRASNLQVKEGVAQLRLPTTRPASSTGWPPSFRWSLSIGLGGRFPSEPVAAFPRITRLPYARVSTTDQDLEIQITALKARG